MNKMSIKEARNIVKELINMVVGNSEFVSFNYRDYIIEIYSKSYKVRVWLDYGKGLLAYIYDSSRCVSFHGIVSKIDDCVWLKNVWEDIAFNNGNNIIQYVKNGRI